MFRILSITFVMLLVLNIGQAFSQKVDIVSEKNVVSLDLRDKPLKLVAEEILKQTGTMVMFDKKWNELPVNGQYIGIPLEEFFWRALRKYNISLSFDEKRNLVNLRFFGDSNIVKINNDTLINENVSNKQLREDIKMLHKQQHQELQTNLNDPEFVDPLSGMKLVDIQEMHVAQQAELEELRNDPQTIEPESGMTNAEIKSLHGAQQAELEQLRNDPKVIEPESGMTKAEIRDLHKVQHAELELLKKEFRNSGS
ncbi:MAG: hypothetical protein KKB91_04540 [Proteobacteria bacterium]|nr:hypothetical protein [Pseudomonadota bacterium]